MIYDFSSYNYRFNIDDDNNKVGSFEYAIKGLMDETWEKDTFSAIYNLRNDSKAFLDIGSWVGLHSMYSASYFKSVIAVEADKKAVDCFKKNTKHYSNIEIIESACVPEESKGKKVYFGTAQHSNSATLGDSGSQHRINKIRDDDYVVDTITVDDIIKKHCDISLIKCDIEGGEENLIPDLFRSCEKNRLNLFLSFHLMWWKNKNLVDSYRSLFDKCPGYYFYNLTDGWYKFDDVELLTILIKRNPTISILFEFKDEFKSSDYRMLTLP